MRRRLLWGLQVVLPFFGLWGDAAIAAPRPAPVPQANAPESVSVPARLANRVAREPGTTPATVGWLSSATATALQSHRPIELAAGYVLIAGGEPPRIAADLQRASTAMHERMNKSSNAPRAYLAQFRDASVSTARQRIEQAGGTVVASISDGTFLLRMNERTRARLAAAPARPWLETWEPAFKLSPRIDRSAPGRARLTALVFPDGDSRAVSTTLGEMGATDVRVHRNGINQLVRFELDATQVATAASQADILWIEPTPRDTTLNRDAQWVVQTNVPESRRVWDLGLRGQGQVVMTSDSGIRANHMFFHDPVLEITGFGDYPTHRKIIAYRRGADAEAIDFGDDAGSNFHGTHTAGSVAGNNDPTVDNAYDGIAKDAKLFFMDLAGDDSRGSINPPADLNDLFLPSYVGNEGGAARISSNSWGAWSAGGYTLAAMQVDQFMSSHPDYLVLFANGNSAANGSVSAPATAKSCVSVGGTGNGANRTSLYAATSRGPTNDLRRKPTLCAPGDLVGSSVGTTRYAYSLYSGTSMATPVVAGALALARQYLVEGWYPTGRPVAEHALNPSAALLKAMAINSGENDVAGTHVPDNIVGWGRLDLDNVLYFPGDTRRTLLIDPSDGLLDRQFVEYQVQVTAPIQPFSVSLCWTDAPGNPAFVRQLVNDLDLVVTNGVETYLGNRMFNNVSLPGVGRDSLNVEEGVRILAPSAGMWTVRIEGTRIPVGPQTYALCLTGSVGQGTGSIALDRFEYSPTDRLEIEVVDTDATEPVAVTVTCPTDPFGETVALGGSEGVYRGWVQLAPSAPNAHDHRLAVSSGDVVTVRYVDTSPPVEVVATARVNGVTPVITEVHARPLTSTVTLVTWTTDVPATSIVRFGDKDQLWRTGETDGYTRQHAVRITGLRPGRTYEYDVESSGGTGGVARDDLGGLHRRFTAKTPGRMALVLNDVSSVVLQTWTNAFEVLGWDVDILSGADADPPLVGNKSVGLRSYSCVLWQVGPDDYPPISDPQRAAIDSLLEGGGRLLITGHDIGYGLSDASVFSYTPEREAWLESGLKTRYHYDELTGVSTLNGIANDPTSGGYVGGLAYHQVRRGSTSDIIQPAPGTDGVGTVNWELDNEPPFPCGLRWESHDGHGHPFDAHWGGQSSRLVAMYFEWAGLATATAAPAAARTDVLEKSVAWLLGRQLPAVSVLSPVPGEVVTSDVLPIHYRIGQDANRSIARRSITYSLDGGESWTLLHTATVTDSVYNWNLGAASVGNSTRALLRVTAIDDGAPSLSGGDVMNAVFTLARAGGDRSGPVLVAGSLRASPTPARGTEPVTLQCTFSDAAMGASLVVGAEYSLGAQPAPGGAGIAMEIAAPAGTAACSVTLPANSLSPGLVKLWVRGRDAAGNWGPAAALNLVVNADERTDTGDTSVPTATYVTTTMPNPMRGAPQIQFGLVAAGEVRLDLFDARGRRVRTLVNGFTPAGRHVASWDGRDHAGARTASGIYFVRLTTALGTHRTRLVMLH